jgi:hypothetical protein
LPVKTIKDWRIKGEGPAAYNHLELTVTGQGDAIEVTGRVVGGSSTLQDARDALVQVSQSAVLEFQVTVRDQELIVDITISTP